KGKITAVQLPIREWERIKMQYPDIENIDAELPDWQKSLLDQRLDAIAKDGSKVLPIEGLLAELDR
ncbi:addiction module protein, partial [Parapedobacter tibetensis]|uniref:addiction module protein n=1 Tax=Parapedobacter tibetensis TaxID=2972951 RepID=UPI00214D3186